MNIKKGIIAGAMVAAIGMTTITGVYAKDNIQVKGEAEIAICTVGSEEEFTFKELSKEFKDNISKADYKKAEALFNKAIKLGDDASKFYDELYKLDVFDYEEFNFETPTFDEFAKDFKKDLKAEDRQKAKKLYEKALQLEKENKIDDAVKVWDELFEMNLFGDEVVVWSTDGDEEFDFDNVVMESINGDLDDIMIDYAEPLTFDEFSKEFKKDVKPEVVKKAKDLFNKAIKTDEESQKAWDELYSMDIFEDIDWTNVEFEDDSTKMDW